MQSGDIKLRYSKRRVVKQGGSLMVSIPAKLNFKEGMILIPVYQDGVLSYLLKDASIPEPQLKPQSEPISQPQAIPEPRPAQIQPQIIREPEPKTDVPDVIGELLADKLLGLFGINTKKKSDKQEEIEII